MNRDPIAEEGGFNLYGFVNNNALVYFDPNGQGIWDQIGVPVGAPPPGVYPLPDENYLPPPLLIGDDQLPHGYEGFSLCQRPLEEDGCLDKAANFCGAGHKFLKYKKGGIETGFGFYRQGVVEEKNLDCSRGIPCKRTNSPLKYGIGETRNKTGKTATDEEILDCIRNRPKIGEYTLLTNDCRHWPPVASQDCGLSCSRQSNNFMPPTGTVPFYSIK